MLEAQQAAPDFNVVDSDNQPCSLSDYQGKNLLLYFYPKDDTPGCTIEANEFTTMAEAFTAANTAVVGVSKDECSSHQAFREKYGLKVQLLADTQGELCAAYGVWQEKTKNGETKMGIVRSTFIIDSNGQLSYVEYGVKPEGHAAAMLAKVQAM